MYVGVIPLITYVRCVLGAKIGALNALKNKLGHGLEGLMMKSDVLKIVDAHNLLVERIQELEEKVKRLENTIHYHRKIGDADGFGYWQMG